MFKTFNNWKVVLLSILGATTFWFFNAMTKSYDATLDYPLVYTFQQDSVIVMQPLAKKVKINVSSGGWNLIRKTLRINATPIEIQLDNPTEIKFLTRASLIPLVTKQLDGLNLMAVVTDTLFIDIEKKISRKLVLHIDSMSIPLSQSHRVISPIECPVDTVMVSGPKSFIDKMENKIEIKFGESDIDDDFDNDLGYYMTEQVVAFPNKANVKFEVSRFLAREVSIGMELLNFPEDSSALINKKDITIYYTVREDQEDNVKASDFSVTADYTMRNLKDSTVIPILMYAHESALDIVLDVDWIKLNYPITQ